MNLEPVFSNTYSTWSSILPLSVAATTFLNTYRVAFKLIPKVHQILQMPTRLENHELKLHVPMACLRVEGWHGLTVRFTRLFCPKEQQINSTRLWDWIEQFQTTKHPGYMTALQSIIFSYDHREHCSRIEIRIRCWWGLSANRLWTEDPMVQK